MHPARAYVTYSFLISFAHSSVFCVYTLYLMSMGISFSDILMLNVVYQITNVLAEMPTGLLADGRGRIWSVRTSAIVMTLALWLYAFATGFWSAMIAEIAFGVGMAFASGADSAWITDALDKRGEQASLKRVYGNAGIARMFAVLFGSGIGLLLNLLWGFRAAYAWGGLMFIVTYLFAVVRMNGEDGEPFHRVSESTAMRLSIRQLRKSYALKWLLVMLVLFALVLPLNHFWPPMFVPQGGYLGLYLVNAMMHFGLFIGSYMIRRQGLREESHGMPSVKREASRITLAFIFIGASLCVAGHLYQQFVFLLSFTFIHEISRGCMRPLCQVFTQHRVESSYRATYGSFESFCAQLGWAVLYGVIWFITRGSTTEPETIAVVWTVCGGLLAVVSIVLWFFRPRRSE